MRTVRVIPCLDVDAGRVVKGVQFVDLRRRRRPGRARRAATTPRAPTSSSSSTSPRRPTTATTMVDVVAPHGRARSSSPSRSAAACAAWRTPGGCCGPAPTRSAVNSAAAGRPGTGGARSPASSAPSASSSPSTPAAPAGGRRLGGLHPRRAPGDRASTPSPGRAVRRRSARGSCSSPRWTATAPRTATTSS